MNRDVAPRMSGVLLHMHIPKCGGTTLRSILEQAVPEDRRFGVDGKDIAGSRAELAGLPAERRRAIRLVYGHLCHGWHEMLPGPAHYFTVLREPNSRVASHYNFVRTRPDHYLHAEVVEKGMSIVDYVECGITTEVNDGQTRQLSGVEDILQAPYARSKIPYGTDNGALLRLALENIENDFIFVGLLERFDETLETLNDMIGIPIGPSRVENAGALSAMPRPTSEEMRVVARYNRQDHELYEIFKDRFQQFRRDRSQAGARRYVRVDLNDGNAIERKRARDRAGAEIRAALTQKGSLPRKGVRLLKAGMISPRTILTRDYAGAWLRILSGEP